MKKVYLDAFVDMTLRFAETSVAERLKVGACILKNGNPIAFGVNGTIPKWGTNTCEDADGNTHSAVIHAEINALNKLRKISESSLGATLIVTHAPCERCSHEILDSGISVVYYINEYKSVVGVDFLKKNGVKVFKYERFPKMVNGLFNSNLPIGCYNHSGSGSAIKNCSCADCTRAN